MSDLEYEVDGGGRYSIRTNRKYGDNYDGFARDAAEDYYDNHDGWEASWPLEIKVYSDEVLVGTFEAEMEMTPAFLVSEIAA